MKKTIALVALLLCVALGEDDFGRSPLLTRVRAQGQTPTSFKVAFYNIRSGRGIRPLPGRTCVFEDNANCTNPSLPLNAWGRHVVQDELLAQIASDPSVVALGLAEAWSATCGSAENVRRALGWPARSAVQNGIAIIARHGFSGSAEWRQLDTTRNPTPSDTMWVVRTPVCLDAGCTSSLNIYTAHWYASGPSSSQTYDIQAQQTIDFMGELPESEPRVLIGDLNVWEEGGPVCGQNPKPAPIRALRDAGYTDAWPAVNGTVEGYTGMWNRSGCGTPVGDLWKRIDYSWSRNLTPLSASRFGMVTPGECAPSDHAGVIAEYSWSSPPPPPPPPPTVYLADSFTSTTLDLTKWVAGSLFTGTQDPSIPLGVDGATLVIGPLLNGASNSHYYGVRSKSSFGFSGVSAHVQLVERVSPAAADAYAMFAVGKSNYFYRWYVAGANLVAEKRSVSKTTLASLAYSATNHQYLRIRHDAATNRAVFETAPDAAGVPGAWTERYSQTWDATIPLTGAMIELKGGTSSPQTNPGRVRWDNVRVGTN
jgi:hypothetical protein